MNKKLLLFLVILVSICAVSHVNAADNSTIIAQDNFTEIETQAIDVGSDDIISSDTNYRTIQEQIDDAPEGGTIYLEGDYYCDYLINVNKPITIEGNGATIKMNGSIQHETPFFNVEKGVSGVVFNNMTFKGGSFFFGGAITWQGDNGKIMNCKFIDNSVEGDKAIGGAILILGENCSISDCIFTRNTAFRYGGSILANGSSLSISNCEFNDNKVKSQERDFGGALVLYDSDNSIIINCTFNNNYCSDYGGAIAVLDSTNNVSIIDCNFYNNYVLSEHQNDGGLLSSGGAIFSIAENLIIDNCNFTGNSVRDGCGGAIAAYTNNDYDIIINSSYFASNSAFNGSDIHSYTPYLKLNYFLLDNNETIKDSVFILIDNYLKEYLRALNNTIDKIKINSSVIFSPGLIFEYGDSGLVNITCTGGIIEEKNIRVLNYTGANIKYVDGVLTISGMEVGDYTLRVTTTPDENHTAVDGDFNFTVKKATAVLKAQSLTVALKSSTLWSITLIDSRNGKPISNMIITLKVYTGANYFTTTVKTNSKGIATYNTMNLAAGDHKIVVSATHGGYNFNTLTSTVKVIKQTVIKFKLIKRVNGKKASLLSYRVLNKKTGKGINGVKIKVLIYTGKKYKTYILKTKKIRDGKKVYTGAVGFSTNDFSKGKHTVKIMPVDLKYKGSVTTYIKIQKSATKGPKFFRKV